MAALVCTNKGCGKSFSEAENSDTACEYHSGAPVFHDALKGWSCCSKKVTDFDDFLKIPGCTVGRHSVVVPEKPEASTKKAAAPDQDPTHIINGKEVYGVVAKPGAETPTTAIAPTPVSGGLASAAPTPAAPLVPVIPEEELNDALDAGWSCCSRKVLEFDEFLKIQGCKRGKHRFTEVSAGPTEQKVDCRRDWYQTPSTVIVSIYAKKLDKTKTVITFGERQLTVLARFQDGKVYELDTPLALAIDPVASRYEVLSTKIEIVLKKANGLSWPTLEPSEGVVSWTTFGVSGGVGTVGGKEAVVAQDAPLHLFRK
ncbi:hypothetical protein HK405_009274 [Cladochytrium tenue]|nr:hypothetical protein HK405_009274 [Cladochytrium tenue]